MLLCYYCYRLCAFGSTSQALAEPHIASGPSAVELVKPRLLIPASSCGAPAAARAVLLHWRRHHACQHKTLQASCGLEY